MPGVCRGLNFPQINCQIHSFFFFFFFFFFFLHFLLDLIPRRNARVGSGIPTTRLQFMQYNEKKRNKHIIRKNIHVVNEMLINGTLS